MHFSLMRLRRFMDRARWTGPGMATVLMVAMLFALTPCCEIGVASAAPADSETGRAHDAQGDARDHGLPQAPDPCLAWLDTQLNILGTTSALPVPERDPQPALIVAAGVPRFVASVSSPVIPSCHSPPSPGVPLYLRTARLRL